MSPKTALLFIPAIAFVSFLFQSQANSFEKEGATRQSYVMERTVVSSEMKVAAMTASRSSKRCFNKCMKECLPDLLGTCRDECRAQCLHSPKKT